MKKKELRSVEQLVGEAMAVCFENIRVSPFLFSRELKINLVTSMKVYEELEFKGIITESKIINGETDIIGKVNKHKLKKYFKN
jgi:hypothetical protein